MEILTTTLVILNRDDDDDDDDYDNDVDDDNDDDDRDVGDSINFTYCIECTPFRLSIYLFYLSISSISSIYLSIYQPINSIYILILST